ncbi:MAG: BTAD domain-containing putative transcriptional regulator [Methylosarcina sp.]
MNNNKNKRLFLSKITSPRTNNPVYRERLFQRLDQLRETPLIWVTGSPGSGKTTLASTYISQRNINHAWHQLDIGDINIATFFHYFRLCVQQLTQLDIKKIPAFTPEYLPNLVIFIRRYIEIIEKHLKTNTIIVFDNYEQLPTDAPLHAVVQELACSVCPNLCILILSRTDPPSIFARLRMNNQLVVFNSGELNLTLDEAQAIAATKITPIENQLELEQIKYLHKESGGWIAGFTLFLTDPTNINANHQVLDGNHQLIFDYFATEIFEHFPLSIQKSLMVSSLLPVMTITNLENLTGDNEIRSILADLQRRNFFVVQSGQAEVAYEYHGLFRAFLMNRAVATITSEEWRNLQQKAANILVESNYIDAASNLYYDARDWVGLTKLVLREGSALISAGRHQILEQWLKPLPLDFYQHYPWLYYWKGIAQLPFDPLNARNYLEKAYVGFCSGDDPEGLYSTWSAIMDTFFYEWQDLRPADRWITEFEDLRANHPDFPSKAIEMRTYWAMGTLLHRQPQHRFVPIWAERAKSILNSFDLELSVLLGGYLIIWYLWKGSTSDAKELIQRIEPWTHSDDLSPLVKILWLCAVGLYHSVRGDLESCLQTVQNGLSIANKNGLHCWDFLLSAQAARCSLIAGDLASAETWISAMSTSIRNQSHINGGFLEHLKSNLAAQRGEWLKAVEHTTNGLAMALESGVPILEGHCRIDHARALIGQGDPGEWQEQLRIVDDIGKGMDSKVLQYLCLETKAYEAFNRGNEMAAKESLAETLALSRKMGGAIWQMAGPKVSTQLYEYALISGIEVDHVRQIIRSRRLMPPDPSTTSDHWPWPIHIYTLGRFEILYDDEPLPSSRKAQNKPLELIKIMCAYGGHFIHQDRVTDALWPDAFGDAAEQVLTTTLHRLRKLLKCDQAIRLTDRQLSFDFNYVWIDALAFNRIAHHPDKADQASLQRALNHYRGHFLAGESAAWALAFCEQLRSHFLKMSERFGSILEAQADWHAAMDCYQRIIEIEPTSENFYRRLMICHDKLGQRAEALAVFQRCRKSLLTHLGVSPTRETQALYQRLIES